MTHEFASSQEWEFAYRRAEMLRQFKSQLLVNISHELRGPLSGQISSLDLILSGLCDSTDEVRDFVEVARDSASKHLQLIKECIELSSYDIQVAPLVMQPVELDVVSQRVHRAIRLMARDRGLEYIWMGVPLTVLADEDGLEQVLLGISLWCVKQAIYGTIRLTIELLPTMLILQWALNGQSRQSNEPAIAINWDVSQQLATAMGGELTCHEDVDGSAFSIRLQIPRVLGVTTSDSNDAFEMAVFDNC